MFTALKFNEKINQRDLEGLTELTADDHTFIDNSGQVTKGKDAMKEGWNEFFRNYPDYRNIFTSVTVQTALLLWLAILLALTCHLVGPIYGLLECVTDVSLSGEYIGLTRGQSKFRV